MDELVASAVAHWDPRFTFGRQDRLIPWENAVRMRDAVAGRATLLMLEDGNYGCAHVSSKHCPITADWLAARLLGGPEPLLTSDSTADLKAG